MPHVRISARAIIRHEGRLLVIVYHDAEGEWCVLPGGGQRVGESLQQTLVRELAEECNATVRVGALRFVRECIASSDSRSLPPGFHGVELFFACEFVSMTDEPGNSPDPLQIRVAWFAPDELRRQCFFPQGLLDALESQEFGYLGVI